MALRIRAAEPSNGTAISDFNRRLAEGGSTWSFYEDAVPDWLSGGPEAGVWREHFLAVDDKDGAVRGGFVLKRQPFLLDGREISVGNVQGPVSEGLINKRFTMLGSVMLREALARAPHQIAWGTSQQKLRLLDQSGWAVHFFPVMIKVVNATRALRSGYLPLGRWARSVGVLARVGLPQVAIKAAQTAFSFAGPSLSAVTLSSERELWLQVDEIWRCASQNYRFIAVRDSAALIQLAPPDAWPFGRVILVRHRGEAVGWAIVRTSEGPGGLRIGSIIDALSLPGCEALTLAAAAAHLQNNGADLIGAVFSHPAWINAGKRIGMLAIPDRRSFAASPALLDIAGSDLQFFTSGTHLTLLDGDGPRLF